METADADESRDSPGEIEESNSRTSSISASENAPQGFNAISRLVRSRRVLINTAHFAHACSTGSHC